MKFPFIASFDITFEVSGLLSSNIQYAEFMSCNTAMYVKIYPNLEDDSIVRVVETRIVTLRFTRRQLSSGTRKAFHLEKDGCLYRCKHNNFYKEMWIYTHLPTLFGIEAFLVTSGTAGYISNTAEDATQRLLSMFGADQ